MASLPTASIFIDSYHPKSDGLCAISIRVTFARKKKYYPTQFKLSVTQYEKIMGGHTDKMAVKDFKLLFPKYFENVASIDLRRAHDKGVQECRVIHAVLTSKRKRADDVIFALGDKFSLTQFSKIFAAPAGAEKDVFSLLRQRFEEVRAEGRISTSINIEFTLKSLQEFHKGKDLPLDAVDTNFMNRYERWMLENKKAKTTIGMYCRNIRTIYNAAIEAKTIPQELYPFGRNKYVIPTGKNTKRALPLTVIRDLMNFKSENESEAKALDYFLFSYLGNGINPKDITLLKFKNLHPKQIVFERAKTARSKKSNPVIIKISLRPELKEIIARQSNKSKHPNDYIFPILPLNATPEEQYKLTQLFVAFINRNMKRISSHLSIELKITSYVARHTHADVLSKGGVNLAKIQEGLGHSDIRTTINYLASMSDEEINDTGSVLTNFSSIETPKDNL